MAPKDFDPSAYVVRRLAAPAADGETVPVSLLTRRETPLDGTAPLLIYGYGAYGYAMDASFSTNRLSLVDRGFVYAIAHVRGGTEKGWRWYEEGKLAKKPNTFADFLAATRHMIARGFADPKRDRRAWRQRRRHADGRDRQRGAGTLRGHHRRRAVRRRPQHDARRNLPLTPPEWLEWGDPIRDAEAFRIIRGYSPYDNVRAQNYPAILAFAGLTDPRVTYWEAAKWVAKLRANMTGGGPILLLTAMGGGHAGAPGRFDRLEEIARAYAFAIAAARGELGGRRRGRDSLLLHQQRRGDIVRGEDIKQPGFREFLRGNTAGMRAAAHDVGRAHHGPHACRARRLRRFAGRRELGDLDALAMRPLDLFERRVVVARKPIDDRFASRIERARPSRRRGSQLARDEINRRHRDQYHENHERDLLPRVAT